MRLIERTLSLNSVNSFGFSWFFFQAEDGIRDKLVTGVQTCALPISAGADDGDRRAEALLVGDEPDGLHAARRVLGQGKGDPLPALGFLGAAAVRLVLRLRSEERRVGKECRSRWPPYHLK